MELIEMMKRNNLKIHFKNKNLQEQKPQQEFIRYWKIRDQG